LKIGFICDCSGAFASSTAITAPVYKAWADYVNAHGGVNGQKIQLIQKDDSDNSGTSLAEVEQMISGDHVAAIADSTNADAAWATYAQQHGVPVIGNFTVNSTFITNSDFFPEGETGDAYQIGMVEAAKKVGKSKLAYLYCAEDPYCAQSVPTLRSTGARLGVNLVYDTSILASAPNYTAQCLAAKQAGADALWVAQAISATLLVGQNCFQQGYKPTLMALDGGVNESFLNSQAYSNSLVATMPNVPFSVTSLPAMKTMRDALKKYAPSALSSANYGDEVVQVWASGLLLQAAAKAGGSTTSAGLTNGLYKLHNETLGGLAPPLTYHRGQQGHPIDCWFYMREQGGKFTTPYGLKASCQKP
jgi:branched-chain amino acid transport system substrate-binding protein